MKFENRLHPTDITKEYIFELLSELDSSVFENACETFHTFVSSYETQNNHFNKYIEKCENNIDIIFTNRHIDIKLRVVISDMLKHTIQKFCEKFFTYKDRIYSVSYAIKNKILSGKNDYPNQLLNDFFTSIYKNDINQLIMKSLDYVYNNRFVIIECMTDIDFTKFLSINKHKTHVETYFSTYKYNPKINFPDVFQAYRIIVTLDFGIIRNPDEFYKYYENNKNEFEKMILDHISTEYSYYKRFKKYSICVEVLDDMVDAHVLFYNNDTDCNINDDGTSRKLYEYNVITEKTILDILPKYLIDDQTKRVNFLNFIKEFIVTKIYCIDEDKQNNLTVDDIIKYINRSTKTPLKYVADIMLPVSECIDIVIRTQVDLFYGIIMQHNGIFTSYPKIIKNRYDTNTSNKKEIFDKITISMPVIDNRELVVSWLKTNNELFKRFLRYMIEYSTEYANYMKLYGLKLYQGMIVAEFCFKIETDTE